ncbi:fumarylacetoacetate hydrolase family protein [Yoonia sp. R2331]|uniref:fumarylacetoacetate hydrolase family protein n=1 Tax=Yoonia sp. R2331 TaxID=3237238 RepID=UPI0034E39ACD
MSFVFPPRALPELPVAGHPDVYAVARIFCVGRNYAAHAAEMGGEVDREAPWYFTKSAFALAQSGQTLPYPPGTANYHHEVELVIAVGAPVFQADEAAAETAIYGYACGLDMTRRDRQQDGKDHRRPWDLGKDVENGAVIGAITPASDFSGPRGQRIQLSIGDALRQDAVLDDMVWSCAEIISHLSRYYHLQPGDLIMTGTPAGVGPVQPGDLLTGQIDGLQPVTLTIGAPQA